MRDRFIVGAGSTYSVGATGGSTTHTLTTAEMPSHTHNATSVVTDPGHFHTVYGQLTNASAGSNNRGLASSTSNDVTSASKTTGITVATTNDATGSGTAFNILNPYYALAYVMKS